MFYEVDEDALALLRGALGADYQVRELHAGRGRAPAGS